MLAVECKHITLTGFQFQTFNTVALRKPGTEAMRGGVRNLDVGTKSTGPNICAKV